MADMNIKKYPSTNSSDAETDIRLFQSSMTSNTFLPFAAEDTSVGMEYELQVAVEGSHRDVDLAASIRGSGYFKNIVKRTARGDLPDKLSRVAQRVPVPKRVQCLGKQLGPVS